MSSELKDSLHTWMHITTRTNMKRMHIFAKDNGFSMSQINAMFRIHYRGAISISDLSAETDVSPAAASQMIDKLVNQGYVSRIEDPIDRRNRIIDLTKTGHEIVEKSKEERTAWLNQLAACFSPAEQEMIEKAMKLLIQKTLEIDNREEIL
ncbi:MAG TPA: MarR family transcriptional regulator [Anaerolineales bacterium]|nr:MarR family transcriptional regulator [Anaerolineales bacterium]